MTLREEMTQNSLSRIVIHNSAAKDIAVVREAAEDPNFTDRGSLVRYSTAIDPSMGPFHIEAKLWYEPIGFRWAHNLAPYRSEEPQRIVSYYDSLATGAAVTAGKKRSDKTAGSRDW